MSGTTEVDLLADIGGTNARFALAQDGRPGRVTTFEVAAHESLAAAARHFLAGVAGRAGGRVRLRRAAIAAAGPVENGRVHLTNAAWTIDAEELREELGLERALLVNDFEALAWSLPVLSGDDLLPLGPVGVPPDGTRRGTAVVLGPGTGFGLAALVPAPGGDAVLVTEAGHASLPAETAEEAAVIAALRAGTATGYVSVETVLCGPGLVRLHDALAAKEGVVAPVHDSTAIVAAALEGSSALCVRTLEMFCAMLGGVAGNAALTLGARGGVFIAGGMARHFEDFLAASAFRARFEAKGVMRGYLRPIPTALICHQHPAFPGLARLLRS